MSQVASISEQLGEIKAVHLYKPATELRKRNRIKTIQSSLEIEGNTLNEEQITALLENRKVVAPQKDIIEVKNAISVYDNLRLLNPTKLKDLEMAHGMMMQGLVDQAGKLRTQNVGIVKGNEVKHVAPQGQMVYALMNDLFEYLAIDKELVLIKSCVFHYELEFIHPFVDGNGRMGRLWQTLILMQQYPVFEYLPVEKLIKESQNKYYTALSDSDNLGSSTPFIEYMLAVISEALEGLLQTENRTISTEERLKIYGDNVGTQKFSRKHYLLHFRNISAPTASRDLAWAVEQGILRKWGEKNKTVYQYISTK